MTILSDIDQARQRVCSYGAGPQWLIVPGRSSASQLWIPVTCSPGEVLPPSVDLRSISR